MRASDGDSLLSVEAESRDTEARAGRKPVGLDAGASDPYRPLDVVDSEDIFAPQSASVRAYPGSMRATQVPRNLQVGDRVQYRNLRLRSRGTVTEELTPQCVVVLWDGLKNSSVHDRSSLEPIP